MSFVYWLHLDSHTDVTKEGYVGITMKMPSVRFSEHKSFARTGDSIIHRAIRKHGSAVKITTLLEGSLDYCKLVENSLRPCERIGWNMAIGGLAGTPHSDETKAKISSTLKSVWTEEKRSIKSELHKQIGISVKTREAQKLSRKSLPSWEEPRASAEIWLRAEEFYEFFLKNPTVSDKTYGKAFNIVHSRFRVMINKFKINNWIPSEDANWLQWKSDNIK